MTKQPHILLAEDDERLAQLIATFLERNGLKVSRESNGARVIDKVARLKPDILILDIMLPGQDGLNLCKQLRPIFHQPILFLTARNSDFDQVLGLEMGADDYVIKPVEPRVLLARINALLRRIPVNAPHIESSNALLHFEQLTLDRKQRQVCYKAQPITFTDHEFELLWLLAAQAGEPVSRELIHQQLLGREYDGIDRSVDVRISRLRKKLGDDPKNPFKIKTIWGKGYLFVPGAWGI